MARGETRRSLLPSQRGRVAQQLRLCKQTTAHGRVLADKLLEGDGGTLVEAVRGVPLIKAKTTWDSGFLHSFMEVHAFFCLNMPALAVSVLLVCSNDRLG